MKNLIKPRPLSIGDFFEGDEKIAYAELRDRALATSDWDNHQFNSALIEAQKKGELKVSVEYRSHCYELKNNYSR